MSCRSTGQPASMPRLQSLTEATRRLHARPQRAALPPARHNRPRGRDRVGPILPSALACARPARRAHRQRPAGWPVDAGLLNYADAGEARKVMTYALPDGRLTWNVAVAWLEAEVRGQAQRVVGLTLLPAARAAAPRAVEPRLPAARGRALAWCAQQCLPRGACEARSSAAAQVQRFPSA